MRLVKPKHACFGFGKPLKTPRFLILFWSPQKFRGKGVEKPVKIRFYDHKELHVGRFGGLPSLEAYATVS